MKRLLLLTLLLLGAGRVLAQGEYYDQRRSLFEVLPIRSSDIVFLGNSITTAANGPNCSTTAMSATAASAAIRPGGCSAGWTRSLRGIPSGCS